MGGWVPFHSLQKHVFVCSESVHPPQSIPEPPWKSLPKPHGFSFFPSPLREDIKEHTFHAGEAWPNEDKKDVMFYAFQDQASAQSAQSQRDSSTPRLSPDIERERERELPWRENPEVF